LLLAESHSIVKQQMPPIPPSRPLHPGLNPNSNPRVNQCSGPPCPTPRESLPELISLTQSYGGSWQVWHFSPQPSTSSAAESGSPQLCSRNVHRRRPWYSIKSYSIKSLVGCPRHRSPALTLARRRVLLAAIGVVTLLATSLTLAFLPPQPQIQSGILEVTANEVGEGDAILLVTPQGGTLLIDAGGPVWASARSQIQKPSLLR